MGWTDDIFTESIRDPIWEVLLGDKFMTIDYVALRRDAEAVRVARAAASGKPQVSPEYEAFLDAYCVFVTRYKEEVILALLDRIEGIEFMKD